MTKELSAVYCAALEVGENPLWNPKNKDLLFIDILGKAVYQMQKPGNVTKTECPQQIGCAAICQNGDLLLALEDGVYRMNSKGSLTLAHQTVKIKGRRFNDGKIGPDGAFYLGTTDDNGQGAFYRLRDGILTELFHGCFCSNGIDWTRDTKHMYYIDSLKHMVEIFDFDADTGALSARRKFLDIPNDWGLPDGMTLDENDNLWVALWGGYRVIHIDKDTKEVIQEIKVPCPKASSCAFGGEDLSSLYITTASINDISQFPDAGKVFQIQPGVKGKAIHYYKW